MTHILGGQDFLDIRDRVSYTFPHKKEVLIKKKILIFTAKGLHARHGSICLTAEENHLLRSWPMVLQARKTLDFNPMPNTSPHRCRFSLKMVVSQQKIIPWTDQYSHGSGGETCKNYPE